MTAPPPENPPWTEPDWLEYASVWIRAELTRNGLGLAGPIEQVQVRPWSIVLRAPTGAGSLFFKASVPRLAHEAGVVQVLSRWREDRTPRIYAVDLDRGWMLMSAAGSRLREILKAEGDLRHWEILLPEYARLQMDLAGRVADLIELGAPDRRLASIPEHYRRLLENRELLRIGLPDRLTLEEYGALRTLETRVAGLCAQIASGPVPESLHHGDFHDGNIFLNEDGYIFLDWGDCSVSHPFFSLRTAFVSIEITLGMEEGAEAFGRLRDAYLDPWTQYAPLEELVEVFDLARRLSPISSALAWNHVVSSLENPYRKEYIGAISSLLREFLDLEEHNPR